METLNNPHEHFKSIAEGLDAVFTMPRETVADQDKIMTSLKENIEELDRIYLSVSAGMNVLTVQRAIIIGKICRFVKDSLLHGEWTDWAQDHFTESLRSLQKFMAISRCLFSDQYAKFGTEKVYQLTRIEHLARETEKGFEDLFSDAGLETGFEAYSSKEFEKTVTMILNKKELDDLDIHMSNESLVSLTSNFSLIRDNDHVLTRLAEAKSEDADLDKATKNIIANNGQRRPIKRQTGSSTKKEDVNAVAKSFIRSFQRAMEDANKINTIKQERIQFIGRLITEYYKLKNQLKH